MSLPHRDGTMRRDILSAYAASGARVLSWVIVSALVYRRSPQAFAVLALVRGTIGILNYASLGLLPAMIRMLAATAPMARVVSQEQATPTEQDGTLTLSYVTPNTTLEEIARERARTADRDIQDVYGAGMRIAVVTAVIGTLLAALAALNADHLYRLPDSSIREEVGTMVVLLGMGLALRWMSDPAGAVLQYRNYIALDNVFLIFAELSWVMLTLLGPLGGSSDLLEPTAFGFFLSGGLLLAARGATAQMLERVRAGEKQRWRYFRPLLSMGAIITLAQLADYLYAPTDFILINRLLTAIDLANYAPAIQIDAGLMLLVSGMAAVLLPKTAIADAAGDRRKVREYYVRGTLASAGLLLIAGVIVYFASPVIFKLWLGNSMPGTRAILPLVLIHTVLGGSSMVGRSILLGIGKAKPFMIAVLISGVTNVAASFVFVRYFGWGLRGIVLGTIVAVVARCGVWMPWYVLRALRKGEVHEGRGFEVITEQPV